MMGMMDSIAENWTCKLPESGNSKRLLTCLITVIAAITLSADSGLAQERFDKLRDFMVTSKVQAEGISNKAVLAALRRVPRHEFVPSSQ